MTIFGKIVLGGLLLVIAGGIFYSVTSYVAHDKAEPIAEVVASTTVPEVVMATTTATTTLPVSSGKKIAFTEFMKQDGSYKCTVTQTVATMTTNGTVYLNDGKVKADFSVSVAGQSISTSMIVRDGYTYTWTSNSPTKGFKTKIAQGTDTSGNAGGAKGTYTWDGSQIGEYSCDPWVAESSLFEVPKTVTFTVQ